MNNPFYSLNIKLNMSPFLSLLDSFDFSEKRFRMTYSEIPSNLELEIRQLFNLPNKSYMAFHKLDPNNTTSYLTKWHIDTHRHTSIIIVASKENKDHYTEFLTDDIIKVPYVKGVPMILNVKIPHKVTNHSSIFPRLALSIGLIDMPFKEVISTVLNDKFINYNKFPSSIFNPIILNDQTQSLDDL